MIVFFIKQKTAYELRISDWSSDVCSSDLALSEYKQEGFTLANSLNRTYKAALAYNFQGTPGDVRPFSKLFNGKALSFLRDFNFTPLPSVVDFRIDVDRDRKRVV